MVITYDRGYIEEKLKKLDKLEKKEPKLYLFIFKRKCLSNEIDSFFRMVIAILLFVVLVLVLSQS